MERHKKTLSKAKYLHRDVVNLMYDFLTGGSVEQLIDANINENEEWWKAIFADILLDPRQVFSALKYCVQHGYFKMAQFFGTYLENKSYRIQYGEMFNDDDVFSHGISIEHIVSVMIVPRQNTFVFMTPDIYARNALWWRNDNIFIEGYEDGPTYEHLVKFIDL